MQNNIQKRVSLIRRLTYRKFSVSWTTAFWDWDAGNSEPSSWLACKTWLSSRRIGSEKNMRQSSTDPKSELNFNWGYWALKMGASCSESPANIMRPSTVRERSTKEMAPKEIWPASSAMTQSTWKEYRFVKLESYIKKGVKKKNRIFENSGLLGTAYQRICKCHCRILKVQDDRCLCSRPQPSLHPTICAEGILWSDRRPSIVQACYGKLQWLRA